ncbi:MAG TPA: alpha-amylase family glycosyl hydrolase [Gaiella sp.]|nr:alpha-amylase family glycosyl hydrolase [Gaiella sp.]
MSEGPEWWRSAVLYEIYVRSFADSDGDGLGDLPGIRSRLPYIRDLGVDGIWLTPYYPSPDADHGYDVSDHVGVDPRYGTLEDFDALLEDAHALDLRLVVDIVPNHVSAEHPWFRNALADPGHPDRRRFLFRPGRDGGPPNNWESSFGGPAWTLDERSGTYYLHLFAPEQPDLDWHNDEVRADFERVLRFWLDRGVDGFRIDVGHAIFKTPGLEDVEQPHPRPLYLDWHTGIQQPELHDLYREWRRLVDAYPGDRLLVGEIVLRDQATLATYVRPDELHQAFNFRFLFERFEARALRATIDETLAAFGEVGAAPTWVLENHDVTRLPTRYGGGAEGRRRARAAALLLLALPGAAYVYAGQELGLEEAELADEHRQDPIFFRTRGARHGRDGCRVPIPWGPGVGLGFTSGTPWLPMPPEWETVSVAAQERDPAASLGLYRSALSRRAASRALRAGSFAWREGPPGALAFERRSEGETIVCAINVDEPQLELPTGELLVTSEPLDRTLPPGTAAWLRVF